ncbi:VOC family protein [Sphingorhabdus sp.]|jgi:2,3-dihydroxybiphenyl 1,2-dioxygenase|uniref:VOC family protein n=1 Tax=Sphingorhabdus sp. TaxID=1902408 RepID=UPI0037CA38C4
MAEISSLGYVGFGVSDLARWEELAIDILGLQVGNREPGKSLALRMDEMEQRIILIRDDADDLNYLGWLFDTQRELEAYVEQLSASGIEVSACSAELASERCVEKVYACMDPNGVRQEFAFGPKYVSSDNSFTSKVLKGRFRTDKLGVGHVLEVARDYQETVTFITDNLGLRVSDYIRAPLETSHGVVNVDATFFHTRTGRHHSLATAQIPSPKHIHHIMLEVENMDDVGFAYDRCVAAGFPIGMTLGHHPNDQMFSFYVATPSGFMIEYGYGGLVIDDRDWEVRSYPQLSDWGHAHP